MSLDILLVDPRADLVKDSHLWVQLFRLIPTTANLEAARILSPRLYYLRAFGTEINRTHVKTEMVPIIGEGNWPSLEFYNEIREKYLRPYAAEIKQLLGRLE